MARKQCECGNWFNEGEKFFGEVLGHRVELLTKTLCQACVLKYANKYSTTCVVCGGPILPGMPVASGVSGEYGEGTGLAHLEGGRYDCAVMAAYCGTWGEGKVISASSLLSFLPVEPRTLKKQRS